jgi:hypothetical protein
MKSEQGWNMTKRKLTLYLIIVGIDRESLREI